MLKLDSQLMVIGRKKVSGWKRASVTADFCQLKHECCDTDYVQKRLTVYKFRRRWGWPRSSPGRQRKPPRNDTRSTMNTIVSLVLYGIAAKDRPTCYRVRPVNGTPLGLCQNGHLFLIPPWTYFFFVFLRLAFLLPA